MSSYCVVPVPPTVDVVTRTVHSVPVHEDSYPLLGGLGPKQEKQEDGLGTEVPGVESRVVSAVPTQVEVVKPFQSDPEDP